MTNDQQLGPLLLVVEDNALNLKLVRIVLERSGYQVLEAGSAEETLERLASVRPDLILMDVQLPGIDGLTLTRRLKADPATSDIPIIALTAHVMKDDRQRALDAGCDGYVGKPINTRTLAAEIAALLRARADRSAPSRE